MVIPGDKDRGWRVEDELGRAVRKWRPREAWAPWVAAADMGRGGGHGEFRAVDAGWAEWLHTNWRGRRPRGGRGRRGVSFPESKAKGFQQQVPMIISSLE